jgi:hypothetical protein
MIADPSDGRTRPSHDAARHAPCGHPPTSGSSRRRRCGRGALPDVRRRSDGWPGAVCPRGAPAPPPRLPMRQPFRTSGAKATAGCPSDARRVFRRLRAARPGPSRPRIRHRLGPPQYILADPSRELAIEDRPHAPSQRVLRPVPKPRKAVPSRRTRDTILFVLELISGYV